MTRRVASVRKAAVTLDEVQPVTLELMERQLIASLHAVWKAQGVRKKVVVIESNGYYGDEVNNG
jgi:hypothetical protein